MQGWYIAIERKSSVGRGIFEIEEEEFEITDVSTTVKYSQKELLRHRVWIKDNRIVFYQTEPSNMMVYFFRMMIHIFLKAKVILFTKRTLKITKHVLCYLRMRILR